MVNGLDPDLLRDLRDALQVSSCLSSNAALFALFIDRRITPWRYRCNASDRISERVDFLIDTLYYSINTKGENALVLFLEVLKDQYVPEDAMHDKFGQLAQKVAAGLTNINTQPLSISFVNREFELERVKQESNKTQYWLIHAPQGYGKTTFLNEITQHYIRNNWICAQIEISRKSIPTIQLLVETIIAALGETVDFKGKATAKQMGSKLASCILRHTVPGNGNKLLSTHGYGVAIALDNVDALVDSETLKVLPQVIDNTYKSLCKGAGKFFKNDHCFCLLMGSRYAHPIAETFKRSGIEVINRPLYPYTYQYVQETTRRYMLQVGVTRPLPEEEVHGIASRLMYYGGGHPGCIATLLTELARDCFTDPDDMLSDDTRITRPVFDVLADLKAKTDEHDLRPIMELLSAFRRIDRLLLTYLRDRHLIPWDETILKLDIQLSQTYLERSNERQFTDGITQRLLLIHLRTTQPKVFEKICQAGIDFYQQRLSKPSPHSVLDSLEYLYLCIQQACHAKNQRGNSFKRTLVKKLDLTAIWLRNAWEPDDAQDLIYQLVRELRQDWELEFLVNYFLSEGNYQPLHYDTIVTEFARRHQETVPSEVA